MATISFKVQYSEFAVALREEVNEYFKNKNLSKTGNWKLYSKTILLFSIGLTCYGLLVFGGLHWAINLGLCAILGIDMAAIGFNVMHDNCIVNFMGFCIWHWESGILNYMGQLKYNS